MLAYPVLNYKERLWLALGCSALGLVFATGFLKTASSLAFTLFGPLIFRYRPEWAGYVPFVAFPALSLLFHVSFRGLAPRFALPWGPKPLLPGIFSVTTAFVFGLLLGKPHASAPPLVNTLWIVAAVPIAEEWLFRGWLWKVLGYFVNDRFFSFTNPLPAVVVGTSLAFACWHIQNAPNQGWPLTLFQMVYAFFASVWLSKVRTEKGLTGAVLCHVALNAATVLGQW